MNENVRMSSSAVVSGALRVNTIWVNIGLGSGLQLFLRSKLLLNLSSKFAHVWYLMLTESISCTPVQLMSEKCALV